VSIRTFTRRFHDETGLSPGHWLIQQRIHRARHLLEGTDLTIDEIARCRLRHHRSAPPALPKSARGPAKPLPVSFPR
jgi:hypothetical protein